MHFPIGPSVARKDPTEVNISHMLPRRSSFAVFHNHLYSTEEQKAIASKHLASAKMITAWVIWTRFKFNFGLEAIKYECKQTFSLASSTSQHTRIAVINEIFRQNILKLYGRYMYCLLTTVRPTDQPNILFVNSHSVRPTHVNFGVNDLFVFDKTQVVTNPELFSKFFCFISRFFQLFSTNYVIEPCD